MEESKEIAPSTESEQPKISMEALEICEHYLENWSYADTAKAMSMSVPEVEAMLNNKEVKRYIDSMFLDQSYMNRFKINAAFEEVIKAKLMEMTDSEMGSSKDIADLLFMMHKMRMDEQKHSIDRDKQVPSNQKNVQINNYGDNYSSLVDALKKKE